MACSHLVFCISRYQIPDDWPYQEARTLFKEPAVFSDDEQPEIKWSAPDEEVVAVTLNSLFFFPFGMLTVLSISYPQGLITFLVNENGFNSDRITKVSLQIVFLISLSILDIFDSLICHEVCTEYVFDSPRQ